MGKPSRDKGLRFEREVVQIFRDRGYCAERVPLSGSAGGSFKGDVTVPVFGADRKIECKVRQDGFREFYKWLDGNSAVVVKADRRPPMVVLPLSTALDLLDAAEKNRSKA